MAQTPCVMVHAPADTVDYTPGSLKLAGTVYVIGTTVVTIVPKEIAANEKGATAVRGVFNVPKDASDVSAGDALYWASAGSPVGGDASSGAFTKTASGNVFAGIALAAAGTGVGTVNMFLRSIDGTVPGNLAPVPVATVAAANSAQNNGAAITALGLTKVTGADNTKAVVLPAVATSPIGSQIFINNFAGANATLAVFPEVGSQINVLGANNVYTQATNTTVGFVRYNNTTWYTN
jgi:predicted RecA/RadA family phage recombinase